MDPKNDLSQSVVDDLYTVAGDVVSYSERTLEKDRLWQVFMATQMLFPESLLLAVARENPEQLKLGTDDYQQLMQIYEMPLKRLNKNILYLLEVEFEEMKEAKAAKGTAPQGQSSSWFWFLGKS